MTYGTVNADTLVTSTSGGILGAGNASIMKNRIINGAMVIDQRNAGASVSTSSGAQIYTVDRWSANYNLPSKFTIQQNAGSVTPPVGFSNYLGITSSSAYAVGASDYFTLEQYIEGFNCADLGWGSANAKTVTLSFQVYSSLTGTFGGTLYAGTGTLSYPFSYSIPVASTWTQISVTIAGPTTGTWTANNAKCIAVCFGLGIGSTYSGTAGSWQASVLRSVTGATSVVGTNGATFYITGVQLEVGSSATGFEYVNYQTSLANCQRYFEIVHAGITGYVSGSTAFMFAQFKVQKRATPTMTDAGTSYGGITLPSSINLNASSFSFSDNYTTTLTSAEALGAASASMLRYNTLQTASAEL